VLAPRAAAAGVRGGPAAAAPSEWRVLFVDVAKSAGLTETTVYGGLERKRFIIETNGSGVAWIDYDNDGWIDALVPSGTQLEEGTRRERSWRPARLRRAASTATTATGPSAT